MAKPEKAIEHFCNYTKPQLAAWLKTLDLDPETPVGVIFIEPRDPRRKAFLEVDVGHMHIARKSWLDQPDPHGLGPSAKRTVAVIAPLV